MTTKPVVWVTGGGRGIGRAIAAAFAKIGAMVIVSGRTLPELTECVNEIRSNNNDAKEFQCDITNSDEVTKLVSNVEKLYDGIDVLVNNAGASIFKPFLETSLEDFSKIFSTNYSGALYATKAVLPSMIARKHGFIFSILSITTKKIFTNSTAYAASKSALGTMMNVLREELRGTGVRIINVVPGATDTAIWPAGVRKKYSERMMPPAVVADAIVNAYRLAPEAVMEEIVLRPLNGDL